MNRIIDSSQSLKFSLLPSPAVNQEAKDSKSCRQVVPQSQITPLPGVWAFCIRAQVIVFDQHPASLQIRILGLGFKA